MRTPRLVAFASLVLLATISARTSLAAWPHDPGVGLHVAPAAFVQDKVQIASDGAGGYFLTWEQQSASTGFDVYAQHNTLAGTVAAGWPAGGIALYAGSGDQLNPTVLSDGVGGAYFAWEDKRTGSTADIYVTRLTGDGNIPSGWIAGGTAAQFDPKDEYTPNLVSDGSGGLFVIWTYVYSGTDTDIYGAHFLANGTKAWSLALRAPVGHQNSPSVVTDGAGGFIFAYNDETSGVGKDVRAARFNSFGSVQFDTSIRTQAQDQTAAVACSDGAGGAIIAYIDYFSGSSDVYATRIDASGILMPGWSAAGNLVCGAGNNQIGPAIVPDGNHGAIIGWLDGRAFEDIYVSHLTAYGALAPGWTPDGNPVSTVFSIKYPPAMVPDGSGGAVLMWLDGRNAGGASTYGSRISSAGYVLSQWVYNGTPIRVAIGSISQPVLTSDGNTAFGVAWSDYRVAPGQIYAQRVDRFGVLGSPEPAITSVKDVSQDQGGKVRLAWNASWVDADPSYGVNSYWVWRQVPTPSPFALAHGHYMPALDGATSYSWEFLASLPASGFPTYSYVAATTTDSMPSGNPRTAFLLQARSVDGYAYWTSAPDSGYSVDNLGPAMPAPFTGAYLSGSTALHWGKNHEPDLANYRLYRGTSAGFTPAPGNLIASPPDTGYVDPGGTPYFYKLSAVDVHGNESPFALLTPGGTLDTPVADAPRVLALRPIPSPARGPMVMSVALPRASDVRLVIYDAAGRQVIELARGPRDAGKFDLPWDGRDAGGHEVSSGLYFARLEAAGRTVGARFVRMR